ncbi:hypothetical protein ABFS82_06G178800 [Erythranthe guttata]|uniref:uncharacterized protein LOC105955616 n=1 Tax=Erythranthe guttata TaxID=4155 RepID=UPI00064D9635|nr:PREDICTED: uncharacterized protein LOC105955616 [Erythranthe guttata]|eukprot:XP_012834832.1 PREDICTED: uncharacterized protein LOC105955616 [Erythranthe guttata]
MALQNQTTTIAMLIFFASLSPNTADENSQSSPAASFYDVLSSNGLPIGLFPKGISDFSIDPTSGAFRLRLLSSPSPCDANFETRVRYERDISGSVNYGRIANLSGVSTQELFLWLPVKGVQVDIPSSGLIYFDVGVVSKQFSLSYFETPKECNAVEDADGDAGGGNDVVLLDDGRVRIAESQSGEFVRTRFTNQEPRAVS